MHLIYVDEAGTSSKEPATVVVALVIHPDTQWHATKVRIAQVLSAVPDHVREGFVFHATTIWNDKSLRDGWSFESRLALLYAFMGIPREMGLTVAFCVCPRLSDALRRHDHTTAFSCCLASADGSIRDNAPEHEIAMVVAEHVPELHDRLRAATERLRAHPIAIAPSLVRSRKPEPGLRIDSSCAQLAVSRLADTIHFLRKNDAPMLQLADACAFGLRRYFARQKFGTEFAQAIFGSDFDVVSAIRSGESAQGWVQPRKDV